MREPLQITNNSTSKPTSASKRALRISRMGSAMFSLVKTSDKPNRRNFNNTSKRTRMNSSDLNRTYTPKFAPGSFKSSGQLPEHFCLHGESSISPIFNMPGLRLHKSPSFPLKNEKSTYKDKLRSYLIN